MDVGFAGSTGTARTGIGPGDDPDGSRTIIATDAMEDVEMTEYRHPLYFSGGYQVVAVVAGREYDPNKIIAYEVLSMSGAKIRQEASVDSAKSWMDRLVEEEVVSEQRDRSRTEQPVRRAPKRAVKGKMRKGKGGLLRALLLRR